MHNPPDPKPQFLLGDEGYVFLEWVFLGVGIHSGNMFGHAVIMKPQNEQFLFRIGGKLPLPHPQLHFMVVGTLECAH